MARTYAQVIDLAEQILEDTGNANFGSTELELLIQTCLEEIAEYRPRKVKETTTTTASSRDITLSAENKRDLIRLIGKENDTPSVEYPVDQDPPSYHNIMRFGDIITLVLDNAPSSADDVYLFLAKKHVLQKEIGTSDTAGAIKTEAAAGVSSLVLKSLGTGTINENTKITIAGDSTTYTVTATATIGTNEATVSISPVLAATAHADDIVTLALADSSLDVTLEHLLAELIAGKAAINKGNTGYQNILTATSGLGTITTAIGNVGARLTAAINDISSGRTETGKMAAIIDLANTEADLINAEVDQAVADLDSGRSLITGIDTAGAANKYASYAQTGITNARGYVESAQSYLREANARQGNSASYVQLAANEFQVASNYIGQAHGYLRESELQLSIARAAANLESWGKRKVEEVRGKLNRLVGSRNTVVYPRT